ncbi:MAG: hypothetical protein JWL75_450 [Parcubacteria group bacterium]|nr:hypothetical protein [Parcubacteria group bacterium]
MIQVMAFEAFGFGRKAANESSSREIHTEKSMLQAADKGINLLSSNFEIEGENNIKEAVRLRTEDPNRRFMIASSHISNLDAPAAIKAFGNDFDLLISASSQNFTGANAFLFRIAGKDNFTPLTIKGPKGKPSGVFNPEDFAPIVTQSAEGKTPWIAAHTFTESGEMQEAKIGSIYLAQKTGSYVIPAALEMRGGGSVSMEGVYEMTKGALNKGEAIYHIGVPYKPEPIDVSIIDKVMRAREQGESVSSEDRKLFSEVLGALRSQAEELGTTIAQLLPEDMRGVYGNEDEEFEYKHTA